MEELENLIPTSSGYRSARKFEFDTDPIHANARVFAYLSTLVSEGRRMDVACTDEGMFIYRGVSFRTWQDVTPDGLMISAGRWSLVRAGNRLVATTPDTSGIFVMLLDGTFDDTTGDYSKAFTKLTDTYAQNANSLANVRNFVVAGGVKRESGDPRRILAWSGLNSAEDWTPSEETLASFIPMPAAHGEIQHVAGGSNGVVFMDSAIYSLDPADPPIIFTTTPMTTNLGLYAPDSVVELDEVLYFYSRQGFMGITRDGSVRPVGYGAVNEWIQEGGVNRNTLIGGLDIREGIVWWLYQVSGTDYEGAILYDPKSGRWGNYRGKKGDGSVFTFSFVHGAFSPSLTLDDITDPLESIERSLDDPYYSAEGELLYFFDSDGRRGTLSGDPEVSKASFKRIPAIADGSEEGVIGDEAYVTRAVVLAEDIEASAGSRNQLTVRPFDGPGVDGAKNVSFIPDAWYRNMNIDVATGQVRSVNIKGRYFDIELELEAFFTNLAGIRLDYKVAGGGRERR